jgi:hypothetical protein
MTGRLQTRSLPPALSRPSSIQLGVLVNRIEAYLDPDGGERKGSISLDNLIRPTILRPGVQVDTPSGPATAAIRWITAGRGTETSPRSKVMTVSIAKASSSSPGRSRKSGLCGRPNPLVAAGEGLVNQYTTGGEGFGDRRRQRTVQIIGHDNAIIAGTEHPWGGRSRDRPAALRSRLRQAAIAQRCRGRPRKTAEPVSSRSRVCRPLPAARAPGRRL